MTRKRAPGGGRKPLATTDPTKKVAITLLASQVEAMTQLGDGNLSAGIRKAIENMSNAKYTYYAYASNEQGATIDVEGRTGSLRAIENAARAQLGSGWQVHVMGVQHDGDNGWFPPKEIKTFRIR